MQDKFGPRLTVIFGGLILAVGFFLASFATPSAPWVLWITYGIMGGIGMDLPTPLPLHGAKNGILIKGTYHWCHRFCTWFWWSGLLHRWLNGLFPVLEMEFLARRRLMSFKILAMIFIVVHVPLVAGLLKTRLQIMLRQDGHPKTQVLILLP